MAVLVVVIVTVVAVGVACEQSRLLTKHSAAVTGYIHCTVLSALPSANTEAAARGGADAGGFKGGVKGKYSVFTVPSKQYPYLSTILALYENELK